MDPITIIDGHVLLPERANWAEGGPHWTLSFSTQEEGSLRGNEGRSAMRTFPRPTLAYSVWSRDLQAASILQARLRRGLALGGKFCCRQHGRSSWLAAAVASGATEIVLVPTPWPWAVGSRLLLSDTGGNVSIHQVTAIDGFTLTFDAAVPGAIPADHPVEPIFFGRMETKPAEDIWSPDAPVTPVELVGESYAISAAVPVCCGGEAGGGDDALTCADLMAIWHALDVRPVAFASTFSVAAPEDFVHCRACLRFVRVSGGAVTDVYCGAVTEAAQDTTVALAAGGTAFYAVEYWGYRKLRGARPAHTPRAWISGSDNFKIYPITVPP